MSTLREPKPVKLVISLIFNNSADLILVKNKLSEVFGDIDFESEKLNFEHSDYYKKEMGENLHRKFLAFRKLIHRDELVGIKIFSNDLESVFMNEGRRNVNIDPGYLAHEHLILATGKGFAHRPYLGKGVYADLTLIYTKNDYQSLDWTYPDYNEKRIKDIFRKLRKIYNLNLSEDSKND